MLDLITIVATIALGVVAFCLLAVVVTPQVDRLLRELPHGQRLGSPWEFPWHPGRSWPPLRLDERLDELAAQELPPLRAPPDPEG